MKLPELCRSRQNQPPNVRAKAMLAALLVGALLSSLMVGGRLRAATYASVAGFIAPMLGFLVATAQRTLRRKWAGANLERKSHTVSDFEVQIAIACSLLPFATASVLGAWALFIADGDVAIASNSFFLAVLRASSFIAYGSVLFVAPSAVGNAR